MKLWNRLFILLVIFSNMYLSRQKQQHNTLIYTSDYSIQNFLWAADSKSFAFGWPDDWMQYSVENKMLMQSDLWPLQAHFTYYELRRTEAASLRFESPNTRFVVYVGRCRPNPDGEIGGEGTYCKSYLELWDREKWASYDIGVVGFGTFAVSTDQFNIRWNQTSTAFIINYAMDMGGGFYTAYVNLESLLTLHEMTFEFPSDEPLYLDVSSDLRRSSVYDVTDDGNYVLLTMKSLSIHRDFLCIWNRQAPDRSVIIDDLDAQMIIGASFIPKDRSAILVFNSEGVVKYDLLSGSHTLISKEISGQWAAIAQVSPDREWIAVIDNESDETARYDTPPGKSIYLFNMACILGKETDCDKP